MIGKRKTLTWFIVIGVLLATVSLDAQSQASIDTEGYGNVSIRAETTGTVALDGKDIGAIGPDRPLTVFRLRPGTYEAVFTDKGDASRSEAQRFEIHAGSDTSLRFALGAANSTPDGAGGIGISVARLRNITMVSYVVGDGPADRAGLKAGETIRKINGQETKNLTMEECVGMVRGPLDTPVTLEIEDFRGRRLSRHSIVIRRALLEKASFDATTADGTTVRITLNPITFFDSRQDNTALSARQYGFDFTSDAVYIRAELRMEYATISAPLPLELTIHWNQEKSSSVRTYTDTIDLNPKYTKVWHAARGYNTTGLTNMSFYYKDKKIAEAAYIKE